MNKFIVHSSQFIVKQRRKTVNREQITNNSSGFSILEIILAVGLFAIFSVGAAVLVVNGYNANRIGVEFTIASQFASEGIEAARSIRNGDFCNLVTVNSSSRGLLRNASNVWAFDTDGTNDTLIHNSSDDYIREVKVESVNRNDLPPEGDIVVSGNNDPATKKVTSTVNWNFNTARPENITLTTYLSDWRKPLSADKGGLLVYGNGGTSSDAIVYRTIDSSGNWGTANSTSDVDSGTTNRYLRAVRVFASSARNEKVMISRHYNGSSQFIYAQVFNGTTWGNVIQLSSWSSTAALDVRNFDGGYLDNGNFLAVFSDNTTTPKYRVWDGCSWSSQASTTDVGGIPRYIEIEVRPQTNEAMMVTFDAVDDTNTAYFNINSWSTAIQHAGAAPTNTKDHTDFAWSRENTLKGALVFPNAGSDTTLTLKIWTADGFGSGNWSGLVNSAASGGRLGAAEVDSRVGAEEFLACQKDANNDIYCFRGNSTPAWASPTNNILTTTSHTGIQRSFSLGFERITGIQAIAVYSDNTATPKLRKYSAGTNAFDASATNLTALGGTLTTVRTRSSPDNDDIMILMGNANNDLFSVVWNGSTDSVYSSGGKAHTAHGISGSATTDFWYDFVWDRF